MLFIRVILPRPHVLIVIEGRHEGHRPEVAETAIPCPREPILEGSPYTKSVVTASSCPARMGDLSFRGPAGTE